MRRCVACASGDRHLSFELMLLFVFDWLVLLFESVRRNGICGLSVVRVKISTIPHGENEFSTASNNGKMARILLSMYWCWQAYHQHLECILKGRHPSCHYILYGHTQLILLIDM